MGSTGSAEPVNFERKILEPANFWGRKTYNIKQMIIYKYVTSEMSFLGIANDFAAQKQLKMIQKEVILAIRNSFNLFPIE